MSPSTGAVARSPRGFLVSSGRVLLRQAQAGQSTGTTAVTPSPGVILERDGRWWAASLRFLSECVLAGTHAAVRLPKPAPGPSRSRRRVRPPGAPAGTTTAPRGLKKRKDLIREMVDSGAELVREGGSHTIFRQRAHRHAHPGAEARGDRRESRAQDRPRRETVAVGAIRLVEGGDVSEARRGRPAPIRYIRANQVRSTITTKRGQAPCFSHTRLT